MVLLYKSELPIYYANLIPSSLDAITGTYNSTAFKYLNYYWQLLQSWHWGHLHEYTANLKTFSARGDITFSSPRILLSTCMHPSRVCPAITIQQVMVKRSPFEAHILYKLCVAFKKYAFLVAKIIELNLHVEEKKSLSDSACINCL
jgi:hypothetical protein